MSNATKSYIGYRLEPGNYAVRDPVEPLAANTALKFGEFAKDLPDLPKLDVGFWTNPPTHDKYVSDEFGYGVGRIGGKLGYQVINGIMWNRALGKTSTDGSVHTSTSLTPADGSEMPHCTLHIEELGGTVEKVWDFPGYHTKALEVVMNFADKGIGMIGTEDYICQRRVCDEATDNPAVIYDDKPAVPTGSGSTPYFGKSPTVTIDVGAGARAIASALKLITVNVNNTYVPNPASTRSGTDEYGKDEKRWIKEFYLDRQEIAVTFVLARGKTYTYDLDNSFVKDITSNKVVLKLQRSATDYQQLTFDTSKCIPIDLSGILAQFGKSSKFSIHRLNSASLSVETKDSIPEASFLLVWES